MKIESDLFEKLDKAGYGYMLFDNLQYYNQVNDYENAECLTIYNKEEMGKFNHFKAPKTKPVTFEWIMNQLSKESQYINLSTYLSKLFSFSGCTIYPTSYGIGIFIWFGNLTQTAEKIREWLTVNNIEFYNEYSDARYVYRFKISKSLENINKIKNLKPL